MQQKPTSHASTKSYGQPMFVSTANQGSQDGATLIARQVQLGPGSWTLLRLGGQFNSRGPYPLGSLVGAARASSKQQGAGCREGSTSIVGQLYHYLMRLPPCQPSPWPGFEFEFILKQAFFFFSFCMRPVRMQRETERESELGPATVAVRRREANRQTTPSVNESACL